MFYICLPPAAITCKRAAGKTTVGNGNLSARGLNGRRVCFQCGFHCHDIPLIASLEEIIKLVVSGFAASGYLQSPCYEKRPFVGEFASGVTESSSSSSSFFFFFFWGGGGGGVGERGQTFVWGWGPRGRHHNDCFPITFIVESQMGAAREGGMM